MATRKECDLSAFHLIQQNHSPSQDATRAQTSPQHALQAEIIKFYDARAPTYDSEPAAFHPAFAADLVQWASAALEDADQHRQNVKILDLACGTGLVSFAALRHFGPESTIHGIDISSASLEVARAKAKVEAEAPEGGQNVTFWEGNVADLDAVSDSLLDTAHGESQGRRYDLITCCSAFVLLPGDRSKLLRKWADYLLPHGLVIFDVPSPETQYVSLDYLRVLGAYGAPKLDRDWVRGPQSVREVIEGAGLSVVDVFETRTYIVKEYPLAELDMVWNRMANTPLMGDLSGLTAEEKEEAKERFIRLMKERAGDKEVIKDEYRMLIGIGKKSA